MTNTLVARIYTAALAAAVLSSPAIAQKEGVPTQALVTVEEKSNPPSDAASVKVEVQGKKTPATGWEPLSPSHTQVAVLIDDGLRESIGRNLSDFRAFFAGLPQGLEVLVGYMQNGTVAVAQPFTADHDQAANAVRLPEGVPGESASPYLCLSDFVKHWPGTGAQISGYPGAIDRGPNGSNGKARVVLMITNGVDPYNGSTSPLNQDSPYVDAAVTDSQNNGVTVYTLYFTDAGMRGPSANFSGQDYLQQLTTDTGGRNLFEGMWNSPDLRPFFRDFTASLARTYIATFEAPEGKDGKENLVRLKVSAPGSKLRTTQAIRPGNLE
jgi:hypothetical protein